MTHTNEKTKVALVTGANKGIGFQIAKALAHNGYIVYVGSRDIKNGETAAIEMGGNARSIQLNITDITSVKTAVEKIQHDYGCLNLLVNTARELF